MLEIIDIDILCSIIFHKDVFRKETLEEVVYYVYI